MRALSVVTLVAVLIVAAPVAAQEVLSLQVFPVVARGPGASGTQWVTDLVVMNPMAEAIEVGLQFFPADQDNMFNPLFPLRISLQPGETVIVEDVLLNQFGLDEAAMGGLGVVASEDYILGNPEDTVICAVTRTYNVGSALGTYGQTVPSLLVNLNVGWEPSLIVGARNDDDFRSNLGIMNTSPMAPILVHFRIKDHTGAVLVEDEKTIRVASMNQWSFQSLGIGTTDGPLTVELWLDPSSMSAEPCEEDLPNGFVAYVSKVDNGTGDAEFLIGAAMAPYYCGVNPDD